PTKYINFDLEDMAGAVRCIMWPKEYAQYGHLVEHDAIVVARASVDRRGGGDEANLIINEIIPVADLDARCTRGVMIRVDEEKHGPEGLKQLHRLSESYPGDGELQLVLNLADGRKIALSNISMKVDVVAPEFRQRVDELLTPGNVRLLTTRPDGSR
ncbi:MAG: OB-fold nucleic acid binding domain-containing protein, partial [Planctomycetota bacterium]